MWERASGRANEREIKNERNRKREKIIKWSGGDKKHNDGLSSNIFFSLSIQLKYFCPSLQKISQTYCLFSHKILMTTTTIYEQYAKSSFGVTHAYFDGVPVLAYYTEQFKASPSPFPPLALSLPLTAVCDDWSNLKLVSGDILWS